MSNLRIKNKILPLRKRLIAQTILYSAMETTPLPGIPLESYALNSDKHLLPEDLTKTVEKPG